MPTGAQKRDMHRFLIVVLPQYTSQTCPECGHTNRENRKTQVNFICVACGHSDNADFVAACNILRAGHAQLACEVNSEVASQQQEPTEAIHLGNSGVDAVGIPLLSRIGPPEYVTSGAGAP